MDTRKLIEKFESRKNNTTRAMDDLEKIMDWITGLVDDVTIQNRGARTINYRASNVGSNGYTWHLSSDETRLYIEVLQGKCVFAYPGEYNETETLTRNDIDYISLVDVNVALENLLKKLSEISDRKEIADRFEKILGAMDS